MKNLIYILDIGSSKVSLLACATKKNKSVMVCAINQSYDGFMDGEFFSTAQLQEVVKNLICDMQKRVKKTISNIYVGVPSEFCGCICKRITRQFVPSRRVTDLDVQSWFDDLGDFAGKDNYLIASISPLQYELDGLAVEVLTKSKISDFAMDCGYILVKRQFVDILAEIFESLNIKAEYISIALAQAQFAHKNIDPLKPIVVVDVGHLTTSVAISKNEGLMMLSSFSLGGGHITADLMQVGNLTYSQADAIKRKVSLTVQAKKDEKYIVYTNNKPVKAIISITNDVVSARIENIASVVGRVLNNYPQFQDAVVYLTGDGVCNFRGALNVFESVLSRKVNLLKSGLNNGEDKYQTSKEGLVNIIGKLV